MSCKHEFVEAAIMVCKKCCKTMRVLEIEDRLAAANERIAELEKDNARQKRLATISRLCKNVQSCRAEKAEQRAEQAEAKLNETYTDENGTVWTRPTAEAYCLICKAYDTWKTKAEQAEAQCAAMLSCLKRLIYVIDSTPECFKAIDKTVEYLWAQDFADEVRTTAGTSLLEENRRMREALEEIAKMLYDDEKTEIAKEALKGVKE